MAMPAIKPVLLCGARSPKSYSPTGRALYPVSRALGVTQRRDRGVRHGDRAPCGPPSTSAHVMNFRRAVHMRCLVVRGPRGLHAGRGRPRRSWLVPRGVELNLVDAVAVPVVCAEDGRDLVGQAPHSRACSEPASLTQPRPSRSHRVDRRRAATASIRAASSVKVLWISGGGWLMTVCVLTLSR